MGTPPIFLSHLAWMLGLNGAGSWLREEKDDPHVTHMVCCCLWRVCKTCDLHTNRGRLLNGKYTGCVFIQSVLTVSKTADKKKRKKLTARGFYKRYSQKHTQEGYSKRITNPSTYNLLRLLPLKPHQMRAYVCTSKALEACASLNGVCL